MASKEYSNGYNAGKKFAERQLQALAYEVAELRKSKLTREDEIFLRCLDMAVSKCDGWTVGGEKVNNAGAYCQLAIAFKDNAIECLNA